MAKKAAQISEAMIDDVQLSAEEQAERAAEEGGAFPEPKETTPPAEPEVVKSGEGGAPQSKKHENFVPFERFEEASRRARENEEYRERWARVEERQKAAAEAQAEATRAAEAQRVAKERPDPDIDPVGARAWDAEQRAIKAESIAEQTQRQMQEMVGQRQQDVQQYEMQNWLGGQIQEGRRTVPDYDARVDYAREARARYWWSLAPNLPEPARSETARHIAGEEEKGFIAFTMRGGGTLRDAVVAMSNQWGYQPANGNGGVRQAAPAQILPSGNERLEQIQRGQAMQGLGRVQSGEVDQRMAWQAMGRDEFKKYVADMDEDEFAEKLDKNTAEGRAFIAKVNDLNQNG